MCAIRDCPQLEPFHYHHDGCPACSGVATTTNAATGAPSLPVPRVQVYDYILSSRDFPPTQPPPPTTPAVHEDKKKTKNNKKKVKTENKTARLPPSELGMVYNRDVPADLVEVTVRNVLLIWCVHRLAALPPQQKNKCGSLDDMSDALMRLWRQQMQVLPLQQVAARGQCLHMVLPKSWQLPDTTSLEVGIRATATDGIYAVTVENV
jgi:hypothetical protein